MKSCELCKSPARMYCDSDQASLCFECDEKVHSANFLVAKHSRTLLCHHCQSPTSWTASGTKLGKTMSVCECCCGVDRSERTMNEEREREDECSTDEDDDDYDDYDDDDDENDDVDEDEEEDGDNQVVPWSPPPPPPPPPPAETSSSSSEEESSSLFGRRNRGGSGSVSLKRMRWNNPDLHSCEDDHGCSTSRRIITSSSSVAAKPAEEEEETTVYVDSTRPLKNRRIEADRSVFGERGLAGLRSATKRTADRSVIG